MRSPSWMAAPLLALALAAASPALAGTDPSAVVGPPAGPPLSGEALTAETNAVSKHLRCPVCQGLSVADSPASSAVDLKAEVRRQLALGYTKDQVIASFERSYGEFIRLEPKAEGFNWLVWLMPALALVVGALVIFFRLRPQAPAAAAHPAALPPHEESKPS